MNPRVERKILTRIKLDKTCSHDVSVSHSMLGSGFASCAPPQIGDSTFP